jgi:L-Ala-D/L-Glu epimerase
MHMKIVDVQLIPLQIPQTYETHWANGRVSVAEHIIVKIVAENGVYGVTEAIPRPGIYGETPQSIYYALKNIVIPKLIGLDSFNFEKIWERMNELPFNYGAKGSIDVALHDLNGKLLDISCAEMLGGPYRTQVPLCWVSGGTWFSEEKILKETEKKVAEGYKGFKVKAGHCEEDIKLAIKLRKICPPEIQINIDPNQLYTREDLIKVGNELSGVINAIEEPIPAWDDVARKEFTQRFPEIAFLSDESTFTIPETQRQMNLGAIRRLGIKIPRTGFTLSRKLVHLAEINDMPAQISTQAETDLGCAAGLQFAAAFKQISLPCEIAYFAKGMYKESMLVGTGLIIKDGMMLLPERPGMGVELNWELVNKYAVKF